MEEAREKLLCINKDITETDEYYNQGNYVFESEDLKRVRETIRHDKIFIDCVKNIWMNILNKKLDDQFTKVEYFKIMLRICKVLIPQFEIKEIVRIVNEEWKNDANGKSSLDFDSFFNAFFELADIWTPTINARHYAHFLKALFYRIIYIEVKTKDGETVKKKPLLLVHFKKKNQEKRLSLSNLSKPPIPGDINRTEVGEHVNKEENSLNKSSMGGGKKRESVENEHKKILNKEVEFDESFYYDDDREESDERLEDNLFENLLKNKETGVYLQKSVLLMNLDEINPMEGLEEDTEDDIHGIRKKHMIFSENENSEKRVSSSVPYQESSAGNIKEVGRSSYIGMQHTPDTRHSNRLSLSKFKSILVSKRKSQGARMSISNDRNETREVLTGDENNLKYFTNRKEQEGKKQNEDDLIIDGIDFLEFTKECKIVEPTKMNDTNETNENEGREESRDVRGISATIFDSEPKHFLHLDTCADFDEKIYKEQKKKILEKRIEEKNKTEGIKKSKEMEEEPLTLRGQETIRDQKRKEEGKDKKRISISSDIQGENEKKEIITDNDKKEKINKSTKKIFDEEKEKEYNKKKILKMESSLTKGNKTNLVQKLDSYAVDSVDDFKEQLQRIQKDKKPESKDLHNDDKEYIKVLKNHLIKEKDTTISEANEVNKNETRKIIEEKEINKKERRIETGITEENEKELPKEHTNHEKLDGSLDDKSFKTMNYLKTEQMKLEELLESRSKEKEMVRTRMETMDNDLMNDLKNKSTLESLHNDKNIAVEESGDSLYLKKFESQRSKFEKTNKEIGKDEWKEGIEEKDDMEEEGEREEIEEKEEVREIDLRDEEEVRREHERRKREKEEEEKRRKEEELKKAKEKEMKDKLEMHTQNFNIFVKNIKRKSVMNNEQNDKILLDAKSRKRESLFDRNKNKRGSIPTPSTDDPFTEKNFLLEELAIKENEDEEVEAGDNKKNSFQKMHKILNDTINKNKMEILEKKEIKRMSIKREELQTVNNTMKEKGKDREPHEEKESTILKGTDKYDGRAYSRDFIDEYEKPKEDEFNLNVNDTIPKNDFLGTRDFNNVDILNTLIDKNQIFDEEELIPLNRSIEETEARCRKFEKRIKEEISLQIFDLTESIIRKYAYEEREAGGKKKEKKQEELKEKEEVDLDECKKTQENKKKQKEIKEKENRIEEKEKVETKEKLKKKEITNKEEQIIENKDKNNVGVNNDSKQKKKLSIKESEIKGKLNENDITEKRKLSSIRENDMRNKISEPEIKEKRKLSVRENDIRSKINENDTKEKKKISIRENDTRSKINESDIKGKKKLSIKENDIRNKVNEPETKEKKKLSIKENNTKSRIVENNFIQKKKLSITEHSMIQEVNENKIMNETNKEKKIISSINEREIDGTLNDYKPESIVIQEDSTEEPNKETNDDIIKKEEETNKIEISRDTIKEKKKIEDDGTNKILEENTEEIHRRISGKDDVRTNKSVQKVMEPIKNDENKYEENEKENKTEYKIEEKGLEDFSLRNIETKIELVNSFEKELNLKVEEHNELLMNENIFDEIELSKMKSKLVFIEDTNKIRNFIKINKRRKRENFIIISNGNRNLSYLIKRLKVEFIEPSVILKKNFSIDPEFISPLGKFVNMMLVNGKSIDIKLSLDLILEYLITLISKDNGYVLLLDESFIRYLPAFLSKLKKLCSLKYINYRNFLNMNFLKHVKQNEDISINDFILKDENVILANPFRYSFPQFCIFLKNHIGPMMNNDKDTGTLVKEIYLEVVEKYKKQISPSLIKSESELLETQRESEVEEDQEGEQEQENTNDNEEKEGEKKDKDDTNNEEKEEGENDSESEENKEESITNGSTKENNEQEGNIEINNEIEEEEEEENIEENEKGSESNDREEDDRISLDSQEKELYDMEEKKKEKGNEEEDEETESEEGTEENEEEEEEGEEENDEEEKEKTESEHEINEQKDIKEEHDINNTSSNYISEEYFSLMNKEINYIFKCKKPRQYYENYYAQLENFSNTEFNYNEEIRFIFSNFHKLLNNVYIEKEGSKEREHFYMELSIFEQSEDIIEEELKELQKLLEKQFNIKTIHFNIVKENTLYKTFYVNMIKNNYSYCLKSNSFAYKLKRMNKKRKKREDLSKMLVVHLKKKREHEKEKEEENVQGKKEEYDKEEDDSDMDQSEEEKEKEKESTDEEEENKEDVNDNHNAKNKSKSNNESIEFYRFWSNYYTYCPVSYINEGKLIKGDQSYSVVYENKIYMLQNIEKMMEFLMFPRFYVCDKIKDSINFCLVAYFVHSETEKEVMRVLRTYKHMKHIDINYYFRKITGGDTEETEEEDEESFESDMIQFEISRLLEGKTISSIFMIRYICKKMDKIHNFNIFIMKEIVSCLFEFKKEYLNLLVNPCALDIKTKKEDKVFDVIVKIRSLYDLILMDLDEERDTCFRNLCESLLYVEKVEEVGDVIQKLICIINIIFEKEHEENEKENRRNIVGEYNDDGNEEEEESYSKRNYIITGFPLDTKIFTYMKKMNIPIDSIVVFKMKVDDTSSFNFNGYDILASVEENIKNFGRENPMYIFNMNYKNEIDELKKEYNVHLINDTENMYDIINKMRQLIDPYYHMYFNYNMVLSNHMLIQKFPGSYMNMYCPYILYKHKWLYKSSNNIKLVYDDKIYFLSNVYHAYLFNQNIYYFIRSCPVPPLRILLLTDKNCECTKEIELLQTRFFFRFIDIEKEFMIAFKYVCIYLIKYLYLFKICKYHSEREELKKFRLDSLSNFSFAKIPLSLNHEDIDFLENELNQVDRTEELKLFKEEDLYRILFFFIKPFNVVLNITKILTVRLILPDTLENCFIKFNYCSKSVFKVIDIKQWDLLRRGKEPKVERKKDITDEPKEERKKEEITNETNEEVKENTEEDVPFVETSSDDSEHSKENGSDESDEETNKFFYDRDQIQTKYMKNLFMKKNEKKILESKFNFLEEKLLISFEEILKYSYRVPEYILYIMCKYRTSYKKSMLYHKEQEKKKQEKERKINEKREKKSKIRKEGEGDEEENEDTTKSKEKEEEEDNEEEENREKEEYLNEIKKVSKKNRKIVNYLKNNTNVWTINLDTRHIQSVKSWLGQKIHDIIEYRKSFFHSLNIQKVDKKMAEFLKNNNYVKLSNFYFYSPVDVDNIVNIDTEYILWFNSFLFYFRNSKEMIQFSQNPLFYLSNMRPPVSFVLPYICIFSSFDLERVCKHIAKELKCVLITEGTLLEFGKQLIKYKGIIESKVGIELEQNKKRNEETTFLDPFQEKDSDINQLLIELFLLRINQHDVLSHGFILYNFPNRVDQLQELLKIDKIPQLIFAVSQKNTERNISSELKNYNEVIQKMNKELNKYKNMKHMIYTNSWKIKHDIVFQVEEKIKDYQRYNRYKFNNKPAFFNGFHIYERKNYENEIEFDKYCVVTYKKKHVLLPCNIYDNYTICYENHFYLVWSYKEVVDFEKNPSDYINQELPLAQFEIIKNIKEGTVFEHDGFCIVSIFDDQKFLKGTTDHCIKYKEKYYLFTKEECMNKFINNSSRYMNNQNIFEMIMDNMKNKRDVTTSIYLKTYLYEIICSSLYELGKHRPLYPGLGKKISAVKFIALYFYKENKDFSQPLRKKYQTAFDTFVNECNVPIEILKLQKKFEGGSICSIENLKKEKRSNWTKRDIEKYEKYLNLFDKILLTQHKQKKIKNS